MNYKFFSVIFGFSVWLIATIIFRFWGDTFFRVENNLLMIVFYLGTIPVLYLLIKWVFSKYRLTGKEKLKSAVLLAIPGMLSDVISLKFHTNFFPTLTTEQAVALGSWVLWAYVIVLVIGFIQIQHEK